MKFADLFKLMESQMRLCSGHMKETCRETDKLSSFIIPTAAFITCHNQWRYNNNCKLH